MVWSGPRATRRAVIVRKLLIFAVLASTVGCQSLSNPFAKKDRDHPRSAPDPLMSPDLDEQQRYGRSRYSYPISDPDLAPRTYSDRPSPSGR